MFTERVEDTQRSLTDLENQVTNVVKEMSETGFITLSEEMSAMKVQETLSSVEDKIGSLEAQMENLQAWLNATEAELAGLRQEQDFHQIQKELMETQKARSTLAAVASALGDLVAFGESLEAIQLASKDALAERLKKDLPQVAANLSEVFVSLTHHPWFDRLVIPEDRLPKLELQVASSSEPGEIGYSPDVLNGQAQAALQLVPYFTFSQAEDAPTEVYLVLLDDPTQAFDTDHIDGLFVRLAELGRHVQLMVGSHETDRVRALVKQNFKRREYVIVEPVGWTRTEGPELLVG